MGGRPPFFFHLSLFFPNSYCPSSPCDSSCAKKSPPFGRKSYSGYYYILYYSFIILLSLILSYFEIKKITPIWKEKLFRLLLLLFYIILLLFYCFLYCHISKKLPPFGRKSYSGNNYILFILFFYCFYYHFISFEKI